VRAGDGIFVLGSGFGGAQLSTSKVIFKGESGARIDAGPVSQAADWTDARIRIGVPQLATTGTIQVVLGERTFSERASNEVSISVVFSAGSGPKVLSIIPPRSAFVGPNAAVIITFSTPVDLSTVNDTSVSMNAIFKQECTPVTDASGNTTITCIQKVCDLTQESAVLCDLSETTTNVVPEDISSTVGQPDGTVIKFNHDPFPTGVKGTILVTINGNLTALSGAPAPGFSSFFFVR
jgi:hypothetical protein